MTRKVLTLVTVGFLCAFAFGQVAPSDYTVKGNAAESLRAGTSLNQAWPATLKVLLDMGFRPLSAEKSNGLLDCIANATGDTPFGKIGADECSGVTIVFEEKNGGVLLTLKWRSGYGGPPTAKKFYKEFFEKLAEALK